MDWRALIELLGSEGGGRDCVVQLSFHGIRGVVELCVWRMEWRCVIEEAYKDFGMLL